MTRSKTSYGAITVFLALGTVGAITIIVLMLAARLQVERATDRAITACTNNGGVAVMAYTDSSGQYIVCLDADILKLRGEG